MQPQSPPPLVDDTPKAPPSAPRRYRHPKSQTITLLKAHQVEEFVRAGYVAAPWDCRCNNTCQCNLRPTKLAPEDLAGATESLHKLAAAIAELTGENPLAGGAAAAQLAAATEEIVGLRVAMNELEAKLAAALAAGKKGR